MRSSSVQAVRNRRGARPRFRLVRPGVFRAEEWTHCRHLLGFYPQRHPGHRQQLQPAEVVCDFESALINSVQLQFADAVVLGCLFI